ncbi:MAG: oligosaccharide flippase family protein [Actinomycetota bacterium]
MTLGPRPHSFESGDDSAIPSIRARVARGSGWLTLDSIFGRVASGIAQLVLAAYLTPQDFGVYALALSTTMFARVFQDAGARDVVVSMTDVEVKRLLGAAFWTGFATNAVIALLLGLAALPLSSLYSEPLLQDLVWLVGLSILASTGWSIGSSILRRQLRFKALAAVDITTSGVQFGGSVLLATLGFGVYSLLWPLVAAGITRSALSLWLAHQAPWRLPPDFSNWRTVMARSKWLVLSGMAMGFVAQGDYFILGAFLSTANLGVYFFGYQLSNQVFALVATNAQTVLLPALVARREEGRSHSAILAPAGGLLTSASIAISGALVAAYGPINELIWNGRWAQATGPIVAFAWGLPLLMVYILLRLVLITAGRYRSWTAASWMMAGGLACVAAIGGLVSNEPGYIAPAIASYLAIAGVTSGTAAVLFDGGSAAQFLATVLKPWAIGVTTSGLVFLGSRQLTESLGQGLLLAIAPLVQMSAFLLLLRMICISELKGMIGLLPHSLHAPCRRVLLIPSQ